MILTVFDMETDGFLDTVSRFHCISYQRLEIQPNGTVVRLDKGYCMNKEEILIMIENTDYLIGHNVVQYEKPVLKILFGIDVEIDILIDSLAMSFYLFPKLKLHGIEAWGERIGIPKPEITDWENLPIEDYLFRCDEDVVITTDIFLSMFDYICAIYDNDSDKILELLSYLTFKMDCLREHEDVKIKVDTEKAIQYEAELGEMFDDSTVKLSKIMPRENAKLLKKRPVKMFKKDGTLSKIGMEWVNFLAELGLPIETTEEVREDPNPGSDVQLKKWLFSLGWVPEIFKESTSAKEPGKRIPQINKAFGGGLCDSVKRLIEQEPELELLGLYFKIRHRRSIFKAFLEESNDEGYIFCRAHGFTNTLRLTHSKPIANIPKPGVFYGKQCREVLMVPDADKYIMIGSDVSGLEDSTKQHYIYPYDPEYVRDMQTPGFDAHLDIGKLANLITEEEEELYKRIDALEDKSSVSKEDMTKFKDVKGKRGTSKSTNFSATYGAGGQRISEIAKLPLKDGMELHRIYWMRNKAIKTIAINTYVKKVRGQKWLYNPVSGFYYFLKAEKDRFSTLNQGTGMFVFDTWLYFVRKRLKGRFIQVCLQYHDELLVWCLKEDEEFVKKAIKDAMNDTNESLMLNVKIRISIDVGENYAECH